MMVDEEALNGLAEITAITQELGLYDYDDDKDWEQVMDSSNKSGHHPGYYLSYYAESLLGFDSWDQISLIIELLRAIFQGFVNRAVGHKDFTLHVEIR